LTRDKVGTSQVDDSTAQTADDASPLGAKSPNARSRPAAAHSDAEFDVHRLPDELLQLAEDDRRRVSAHLHGEIEPVIIAVKLLVEDVLHRLDEGSGEACKDLLSEVPQKLRQLIDGLREIADGMHPHLLDELGLAAAIEWRADAFAAQFPDIGVVRRITAADDAIGEPVRGHIYRIAEEALHQAGEFARVEWMRVSLYRDADALHFIVEHNGAGANPSPAGAGDVIGRGLAIIRRRVESSGGRLGVRRRAGIWNQLHAAWPDR
jgi:signal transduction histidine kinase